MLDLQDNLDQIALVDLDLVILHPVDKLDLAANLDLADNLDLQ